MIFLITFAFLAGLVTALSPCILPILPLLLAAGFGAGHSRALGIVTGLVCSFTFFTLTLAIIVQKIGVSPDVLRFISIGIIIFFGLSMLVPGLEELLTRIMAPFSRIGGHLESNVNQTKSGYGSGLLLGVALGALWSPCAGPLLATITTLAATHAVTISTVIITLAYNLGTALPMFLIMYGGGRIMGLVESIKPHTQQIRKLFGVLMIVTALAIAFHLDVALQQITVRYFPVFVVEDTERVTKELETLQNRTFKSLIGEKAPEIIGIDAWVNTAPLTIGNLKGKVVLIDFWTYSCINCVRTLPYLKKWYDSYRGTDFLIIGIHTPEFEFEKSLNNVQDAVKRFGISYPVALDNQYQTWRHYNNRYWPAHYLIDQQGIIRYTHFGEGHYNETENMIRSLLGLGHVGQKTEKPEAYAQTPEIYLGYKRAANYSPELILRPEESVQYDYTMQLQPDHVGLKGNWLITSESIIAQDNYAQLTINFIAGHVYLVMSALKPSAVKILFDGKPVPPMYRSKDMDEHGAIIVDRSRMYTLLNLKNNKERHLLTLEVSKGVSLYAFTFGNSSESE